MRYGFKETEAKAFALFCPETYRPERHLHVRVFASYHGVPEDPGTGTANGALGGHAYLWAIALNSAGTLFLVGGALLSIARRRNVRASVWIAAGAVVVALATGLSRGGDYSFVYLGQLVGIVLMFAGFTLPASRTTPAGSELVAHPGLVRKPL